LGGRKKRRGKEGKRSKEDEQVIIGENKECSRVHRQLAAGSAEEGRMI
jgi:hypothetical protein